MKEMLIKDLRMSYPKNDPYEILSELVVLDVGCGNGKYLNINPDIFVIGSDRCLSLAQTAREKDLEVGIT